MQCEVTAEVCSLWCRLLPYPVTLVKNTCVHTWYLPLCSSWAKSSSHLCMPKEPKCSHEPVSDFALKWIKIMHKIQSVSVAGLVTARTEGTLNYSCPLELLGLFKELGKWGRENHKEWSSLGTCQSCAVILGPWLLSVCLLCRARNLWAFLSLWLSGTLECYWWIEGTRADAVCCGLPAWTGLNNWLNERGSTLVNTSTSSETRNLGTSVFQRVIPGFQQFCSSLPAWFFSLLVSQMEQWKEQVGGISAA